MKCTARIVLLMWIHISDHKYKYHYDSCVSLHMNCSLKMLGVKNQHFFTVTDISWSKGVFWEPALFLNIIRTYYMVVFRM
jgi:hypothetical protein